MLIIPSVILAIEDENDRDFMEQVYRQYHRLMYHTIYQLTDDPWLADDVLQITLVKLIDNIPTLRSLSNTKRINYIISAVKNSTYTQLRKTKNHPEIDIEEWMMKNTLTAEDNPELLAIHKEEIQAFSQIWPKLDDKNRLLLEGRFILGKSYEELAVDLGMNPSSVRMAVTRAKRLAYQKWRKYMKE